MYFPYDFLWSGGGGGDGGRRMVDWLLAFSALSYFTTRSPVCSTAAATRSKQAAKTGFFVSSPPSRFCCRSAGFSVVDSFSGPMAACCSS